MDQQHKCSQYKVPNYNILGIKSVTRMVTGEVNDALGCFCSKANPLKIWNKASLLIKVTWRAGGHGKGVVSTRE